MQLNNSDDFIVISREESPRKLENCISDDQFIDLGTEIEELTKIVVPPPSKYCQPFRFKDQNILNETDSIQEPDMLNLSESLSQISINPSAKNSGNSSRINPADYLHHQYSSKVIKDKKTRRNLLEKHKSYMKDLTMFQNQNYYNEKADLKDRDQYFAKLNDISNITFQDLHNLISSTKKVYKRGKELYSIIDRHPDSTIRDVYTSNVIEDENGVLQCEGFNEEHSFPQCYQAGTNSGAGKDLHQIFASDKSVNYSRGKKPLGVVQNSVFVKDSKCGKVYKVEKMKSFIPHCNQGAIARAFLYVLACYGAICDNRKFPIEYLKYVIQVAADEPVTLWEKHRNAEIFKRQGNRNPFIDFPEWAKVIDFVANGFR